jgi:hypothetical protein
MYEIGKIYTIEELTREPQSIRNLGGFRSLMQRSIGRELDNEERGKLYQEARAFGKDLGYKKGYGVGLDVGYNEGYMTGAKDLMTEGGKYIAVAAGHKPMGFPSYEAVNKSDTYGPIFREEIANRLVKKNFSDQRILDNIIEGKFNVSTYASLPDLLMQSNVTPMILTDKMNLYNTQTIQKSIKKGQFTSGLINDWRSNTEGIMPDNFKDLIFQPNPLPGSIPQKYKDILDLTPSNKEKFMKRESELLDKYKIPLKEKIIESVNKDVKSIEPAFKSIEAPPAIVSPSVKSIEAPPAIVSPSVKSIEAPPAIVSPAIKAIKPTKLDELLSTKIENIESPIENIQQTDKKLEEYVIKEREAKQKKNELRKKYNELNTEIENLKERILPNMNDFKQYKIRAEIVKKKSDLDKYLKDLEVSEKEYEKASKELHEYERIEPSIPVEDTVKDIPTSPKPKPTGPRRYRSGSKAEAVKKSGSKVLEEKAKIEEKLKKEKEEEMATTPRKKHAGKK